MPINVDKDLHSHEQLADNKNENHKVVERPQENGYTYTVNQDKTKKAEDNYYEPNNAYDINKYSNNNVTQDTNSKKPETIDDIKNLKTPELKKNVMRVNSNDVNSYLKNLAKKDSENVRDETIFVEALKYGTQSALYYRSYQINNFLKKYSHMMDSTFVFQPLLLAHGKVVPPVILEGEKSMFQNGDTSYTEVDKTFKIYKQARILNTPLTWRTYVDYHPSKPDLPDKFSLPLNSHEDKIWSEGTTKGWEMGLKQANDIFDQQIKELEIDYVGMVRYHLLLKAGIVNNPIMTKLNLGINKDKQTINIGETKFEITKLPDFNSDANTWKALPRIKNFIKVNDIVK